MLPTIHAPILGFGGSQALVDSLRVSRFPVEGLM